MLDKPPKPGWLVYILRCWWFKIWSQGTIQSLKAMSKDHPDTVMFRIYNRHPAVLQWLVTE